MQCKGVIFSFWLMFLFLISTGCTEYSKIYKGTDTNTKFTKATELFQNKEYIKSIQLFEQLQETYNGNPDSLEIVDINIAYAYFNMKDFVTASMYFKDFTDKFAYNSRMIECAYMALYCDVLSVGNADLDQTTTPDVIEALQTFINHYPESNYVEKCNGHIDALRAIIHNKSYFQVKQYYLMKEYKAASAAAQIAILRYPDIPQKEELDYIAYYAYYLFAINSVESKRIERLLQTNTLIQEYLHSNPSNAPHVENALLIRQKNITTITKLKETT
ncbi:MAG: outer membrane protein assembly factor BamD [Flavobacteriaceae bacterium]|nr:outer membrane protein assembly factor BamD [Flavobacteriaceae bacterium]